MAKKRFKDTRFAQFLGKAVDLVPDIGKAAAKVALGNPIEAIKDVADLLAGNDESEDVSALRIEFTRMRQEFEREMLELEVEDRKDARAREVALAQAGKSDWMMRVTGIVGLVTFVGMIVAVVFMPVLQENKLFIHIAGMVEGAAMSIFAFYYGTSKSSSDKNETINRVLET